MTRSPNSQRGEASFEVDGRVLLLRPSFENLVATEEEIGSLFALVERASDGKITLAEIAALLWHCTEDLPRPTREAVGRAVLDSGIVSATKPVRQILAQVLQGKA